MLAVVCGAGLVGRGLVEYLVENGHDVVVIDSSAALINEIVSKFDVRAIVGHAAYPKDLERAGTEDADLIFAFTRSDEVNMMACQIAHSLFEVSTKIARVRSSAYTSDLINILFSDAHIPVDYAISPEEEVAQEIVRCLFNPGVFSLQPMVSGRLMVAGIQCLENAIVANAKLRELSTLSGGLAFRVLAITRDNNVHYPISTSNILPGDDLFIVADTTILSKVIALFGHDVTQADVKRAIIIGAGRVGREIINELQKSKISPHITIIESDADRAREIAESYPKLMVLSGNALSTELLTEAGANQCDVIISVTGKDDTNLFASLLAKKTGTKRAISIVNESTFMPLLKDVGIDVSIFPRESVISSLIGFIRKGAVVGACTLREGFAEVFDIEINATCPMLGKSLQKAQFPDGVVAGLIVRADGVVVARNDTNLERDDRLVLVADKRVANKVEKMFSS